MCKLIPTFNSTITILNRLKGSDSPDKLDKWHKTILKNCFFTNKQSDSGTKGLVSSGVKYICRVYKNKDYYAYNEWKINQKGFTFSLDDYIFLGAIEEENINTNNIVHLVNKYKPDAFQIKFFKDNTKVGFLDHYHLEGV